MQGDFVYINLHLEGHFSDSWYIVLHYMPLFICQVVSWMRNVTKAYSLGKSHNTVTCNMIYDVHVYTCIQRNFF